MDNSLVISQTEKVYEALFCKSNVLHEKISFNKDIEVIYFLDILITKNRAKFLTSVYRNSFTGQYLHFQSFCTKSRKINQIRTLYHRALYDLFSWIASF